MSCLVLSQTSPLARVLVSRLRNKQTRPPAFREAVHQLSLLLATKAADHLCFEDVLVKTPLEETIGTIIRSPAVLVPIMRSGSGMLPAFQTFLPGALVWHVSMSRDEETLEPNLTGSKIPHRTRSRARVHFVLDPMLATGGSASLAIQQLKKAGARTIVFVGIFGAPEGVDQLQCDHPDVPVILAVVDRSLNKRGFIQPGCGDAGDRQFPTK
ncbi:uracil phosphoribosyltransferase [Candidatus Uhrbacteria bacterium]|nr:uracil phosphoribosyltransferase [Candidatus Uhrbacteria bacterium]